MIRITHEKKPQYGRQSQTSLFILNFGRVLHLSSLIFIIVFISGCVTLPRGAGLNHATPVDNTIEKKVWLSKVEIMDPSVKNKSTIEDSLTLKVLKYLQEGRYFYDPNLLPGKVGAEDLVLRFEFDRYHQQRAPHPAYFPAAILTATFYIWFDGPIYNDSSNLSGKLTVESSSGSIITEVSSQLNEHHGVSFWSPEYVLPSGIEARTSIINDLLTKASADIRQKGR